ncbi:MAG TPA: TetR/AcrR family transcriptional regulator [Solirubrobacteraceae bacterium]|jgi:AcrR family transcriptional regulator
MSSTAIGSNRGMAAARSRAEKKLETRNRLIDAAGAVFARRGFHGASVEEVAAEAGLTTGALYWHFKGKQELFLALADQRVAARIEEIRTVNDRGGDASTLEHAIEQQFQEFIAREPEWPLLYYEFWVHGTRDPALSKEFTRRRRAVQTAIAEGIEQRAKTYGVELPIPAKQIALGLNALMNGLAFERIADRRAVPNGLAGFLISRYLIGILSRT